jgi:DNA-directed RNA polymerase I and III subunit RPAC1
VEKAITLMHRLCYVVNVESEGPYEPQRLPLEAIRVMREKISALKSAAEALGAQGDRDGDIEMADT